MSARKVKEIIFLGTGTSAGVPSVACLTDPEQSCRTCLSTQTPEGEKNVRHNTSLLVRVEHEDGRLRNIVIDCGKSWYASALRWWPHYKLREIDAVILTHAHADAVNGLDDLRAWTINGVIQEHISIFSTQSTKEAVQLMFPYLVDMAKATGGGLVPSLSFNSFTEDQPFFVEGVEFIPLPVHHGVHFEANEPYICLGFRFENITYISDCNFIPEDTIQMMHGSELVILDALHDEGQLSHFSIKDAIAASRGLNPKPKRTYLTGFSHRVYHSDLVEELESRQYEDLGGLWVRPAHDGLKIAIEELH